MNSSVVEKEAPCQCGTFGYKDTAAGHTQRPWESYFSQNIFVFLVVFDDNCACKERGVGNTGGMYHHINFITLLPFGIYVAFTLFRCAQRPNTRNFCDEPSSYLVTFCAILWAATDKNDDQIPRSGSPNRKCTFCGNWWNNQCVSICQTKNILHVQLFSVFYSLNSASKCFRIWNTVFEFDWILTTKKMKWNGKYQRIRAHSNIIDRLYRFRFVFRVEIRCC